MAEGVNERAKSTKADTQQESDPQAKTEANGSAEAQAKPDVQAKRRILDELVPVDPLVGTVIAGELRLETLLGTGGWSRVYKAKRLFDGQEVAIKILHSHLLFDSESVARFAREAQSGVTLDHENICRVFDYDRLESGQPYIVMEYMDGESLGSLIARQKRLQAQAAVPIFLACCHGLSAAHKNGIVHRDIKPANIFILKGSTVKILDFGLAKIFAERQSDITHTGTAFGTVQYMSPQQVRGERIDSRSDVYSLGCVMYEALTGQKVFSGQTAYEVMDKHVHAAPKRFAEYEPTLDAPWTLESVILKMLEKNPQNRYQNFDEVAEALEKLDLAAPPYRAFALNLRTITCITVFILIVVLATKLFFSK